MWMKSEAGTIPLQWEPTAQLQEPWRQMQLPALGTVLAAGSYFQVLCSEDDPPPATHWGGGIKAQPCAPCRMTPVSIWTPELPMGQSQLTSAPAHSCHGPFPHRCWPRCSPLQADLPPWESSWPVAGCGQGICQLTARSPGFRFLPPPHEGIELMPVATPVGQEAPDTKISHQPLRSHQDFCSHLAVLPTAHLLLPKSALSWHPWWPF